ncbi:hypothetical protein SAMN05443572_10758 [Myxococcus fulvus]|uniref:Uncharacterized protein n=1 Tax=Myxococcus fulvus TaxID=33 RepID=A0A511T7S5_MYXFU|nr:hypothetical protein [Myxococcus fulvus]GEN10037.1 hypothetical protein MFU01_50740 [Myxococcus fulvus]SEU25172.1 hypothetical protein SAMN05443572_10758 [Myxococcus fulvus]
MTRYAYDVVLLVDVSSKERVNGALVPDGPRDDLKYLRVKSPAGNVRRYIYRPEQALTPEQRGVVAEYPADDFPEPDETTPAAGSFFAELQRLANRRPSRLTILAHGLPGVIGKYPRNGYPGLDGRTMAMKLRRWGLRDVARISVIACHAAVKEKIYFTDDELPQDSTADERKTHKLRREKQHFAHASIADGTNLFAAQSPGLAEEARLLKGSFAQELHAALGDPSLPHWVVKTEVSARVMRMVTTAEGQSLVEFPFWMLTHGRPALQKGQVTSHAPGSKFIFYWEGDEQAVRVATYASNAVADDSDDEKEEDTGFVFQFEDGGDMDDDD